MHLAPASLISNLQEALKSAFQSLWFNRLQNTDPRISHLCPLMRKTMQNPLLGEAGVCSIVKINQAYFSYLSPFDNTVWLGKHCRGACFNNEALSFPPLGTQQHGVTNYFSEKCLVVRPVCEEDLVLTFHNKPDK